MKLAALALVCVKLVTVLYPAGSISAIAEPTGNTVSALVVVPEITGTYSSPAVVTLTVPVVADASSTTIDTYRMSAALNDAFPTESTIALVINIRPSTFTRNVT